MYLSSGIVKDHSGEGTAKDIVKVVEDFLEKEKLSEQLVARDLMDNTFIMVSTGI